MLNLPESIDEKQQRGKQSQPKLPEKDKARPDSFCALALNPGGSQHFKQARLWRRGRKEVCFYLQQGRGAVLALDILTHKLGRRPVCSWAEKLQLKMYDFGLPEEAKVSAGLCKHLEQRR